MNCLTQIMNPSVMGESSHTDAIMQVFIRGSWPRSGHLLTTKASVRTGGDWFGAGGGVRLWVLCRVPPLQTLMIC